MSDEIERFLTFNRGYLKWGKQRLADKFKTSIAEISKIKKGILEKDSKLLNKNIYKDNKLLTIKEWKKFKKIKKKKDKLTTLSRLPEPYLKGNVDNILVIGDIHEPFSLNGYLQFVRRVQEEYNCGTVVFIGDIIDNHYASYHETETNGLGADDELSAAILKIKEWYSVFPTAFVLIGNHDRMAFRKAKTSGVSAKWVRDYDEVLGTPGWTFVESVEIDGVNYNHGEGGTAKTKMKNELQSQVQGHLHSQAYIEFSTGKHIVIFGMQVGCGVDDSAYAMAYGKNFKKSTISCGVVKQGRQPILISMNL